MKKIIYTGAFRFPNGDAASQRVLNNAKIFRELGYTVEFLSWGGTPREEDRADDGFYYYQGFRYVKTGDIDKKDELNFIQRIDSVLRRGKKSYQLIKKQIYETYIIIAYNSPSYFTNLIFTLCSKYNKLLISDITEWYSAEETPGGKLSPFYWLSEYNMKFVQKKIPNKIVISSFLDAYYSKSNNIILPPLVDSTDEKWNVVKDVLSKTDNLRVIYAGTPGLKDQLQMILQAVVSCIEDGIALEFVVLGVTSDDIKGYTCYEKVLCLSNNIHLLGKVPQEDVPSYYKVSDFSILVRENNRKTKAGFPTKLVESLTAGCPIIVNYTSDIEKYVIDNKNGIIINDFSEYSIKNALFRVKNLDKIKIEELKNNAKKLAYQTFDYNCYIKPIHDFLNT